MKVRNDPPHYPSAIEQGKLVHIGLVKAQGHTK